MWALVLALLSAPPSEALRPIPALTLAVENPRSTGRRLLHLEDVIGPEARPIAKPARAVLIVCLAPFQRQPFGMDLGALSEQAGGASGGLVLGVLAVAPPGSNEPRLDPETMRFVVLGDPHGLGRQRLGLSGPGHVLVVRSDGRIVGDFPPGRSALEQGIALFSSLLKEDL
ncbi:MAG: hypothetical protein U1E65_12855 [Myxococcota bacterium]